MQCCMLCTVLTENTFFLFNKLLIIFKYFFSNDICKSR